MATPCPAPPTLNALLRAGSIREAAHLAACTAAPCGPGWRPSISRVSDLPTPGGALPNLSYPIQINPCVTSRPTAPALEVLVSARTLTYRLLWLSSLYRYEHRPTAQEM